MKHVELQQELAGWYAYMLLSTLIQVILCGVYLLMSFLLRLCTRLYTRLCMSGVCAEGVIGLGLVACVYIDFLIGLCSDVLLLILHDHILSIYAA